MCGANRDVCLFGKDLAPADLRREEIGREGQGVYCENVGRGRQRDGDAGRFGGYVRVIAVSVGEGVEL